MAFCLRLSFSDARQLIGILTMVHYVSFYENFHDIKQCFVVYRIWGINCGTADKYGSYRDMYLQRPHLRFNGLYSVYAVILFPSPSREATSLAPILSLGPMHLPPAVWVVCLVDVAGEIEGLTP